MTGTALTRLAEHLTSRRGALVCLGVALVVLIGLFSALGGIEAPARSDPAPRDSESAQASALLAGFPDADQQSVLVVASRRDGAELTDAELAQLSRLLPVLRTRAAADPSGPMVSGDGRAALLVVPITVASTSSGTAEQIGAIRGDLAGHGLTGVDLQVTGGPAFGADVAAAFDGADVTLLMVTLGIVALLLIVTYRSPVLWLLPLAVVGLADGLAAWLTAAAGTAWGLQFDAGIVSVLVFGAGTNYALLLISRYRETLQTSTDDRRALAVAWRETAPAILASNATVVLALLTLTLARIPGTHGLGVASAIGLVIAAIAVLLVLPAGLALVGRRVFWPFVPRPNRSTPAAGRWRRIAAAVVRRPLVGLLGATALLAVMVSGLAGTSVGLDQVAKFRGGSESAAGLEVLAQHFPPGEAQPTVVVTDTARVDAVVAAARGVAGVVRVQPLGTDPDRSLSRIMVVGRYAPSTTQSLDQVAELRAAVHAVDDGRAWVGGAVATDLDARTGNRADLERVVPLVLAVAFVVLLILLRSLVAPLLLVAINLVSAVAAIGAGSFLSRTLFDQPALDLQVPLLSFLFLVALGIDYTIFLVHRTRREAPTLGTRAAMVSALAHTGGVITSAGIVLAAVFAALGVLPLVTLGQLGLIVGIGVLVDTLVVRSVVVPAVFALVGDRIWWPGRAGAGRGRMVP